jgi:hypothetical protein
MACGIADSEEELRIRCGIWMKAIVLKVKEQVEGTREFPGAP